MTERAAERVGTARRLGLAPEVPLRAVDVRVRVEGPTSRTRLRQTYQNDEGVPVEATYVFPLPEGAAVCGFALEVDDHLLRGHVKDRDGAFDDYDDALANGRTAALVDQERPDVFTASVGNLLPGQTACVVLDWVSELPRAGEGFRLSLPSTVSPRYVPASSHDAEGMDDAERLSPPVTLAPLPYGMSLTVDIDLHAPLRTVSCPTHAVALELDGSRATVTLARGVERLDRDFVLNLVPADPVAPLTAHVCTPEGEGFVVASVTPRFGEDRSAVDVVFVIDCSGSMQGPSIASARDTLRLCLRSLQPGDRFDLLGFGTTFRRCFGEPRPYDDRSLLAADRWVKAMDADLGGTELLAPLQAVLGEFPSPGRPRRLVVVTDGQVSNESEVLAVAAGHRKTTKIFSFGVGHGASEHLVRGLARASGGAAEFLAPGEPFEEKVLRQFDRLCQVEGTGLRVEWEGLEAQEGVPAGPVSVYSGEPFTVFARARSSGPGTAVFRGTVGGAPWELRVPVPAATQDPDSVVPTFWARRRLEALEDERPYALGHGSRQARRAQGREERAAAKTREELVALGTRYGLLSSATSYVVVDDRPDAPRAELRARLRRIPVALTRGWHGVASPAPAAAYGPLPPMPAANLGGVSEFADRPQPGMSVLCERSAPLARAGKAPRQGDESPDLDVLLSQRADGYWLSESELARWAGLTPRSLSALARQWEGPDAPWVVATMVVLHVLRTRPGGVPKAWRAPLKKAEKWLAGRVLGVPVPDGFSEWSAWIGAALGRRGASPLP